MEWFPFIKRKKLWAFIGGVAAGLVVPAVAKSKTAHKAAVNVMAKSMTLKDDAKARYESVKEDAQDVYAEAKHKAAEGDAPSEAPEPEKD